MHLRTPVHIMELEVACDGKAQIRAEGEQPETATIHVANTAITNDTFPYTMASTCCGIEIAQQYDSVSLQDHSEE